MRGDWLKICRASQPNSTPRSNDLTSPPELETWPPISTDGTVQPAWRRFRAGTAARRKLSAWEVGRTRVRGPSMFPMAVPIRGLQGCTPLSTPPKNCETSTQACHGALAPRRARRSAERGTWTSPHGRLRRARTVPGPGRVAQSRAPPRARGAHLGGRRRRCHRVRRLARDRGAPYREPHQSGEEDEDLERAEGRGGDHARGGRGTGGSRTDVRLLRAHPGLGRGARALPPARRG